MHIPDKDKPNNKPATVYDSLAENYLSWIEESPALKLIYRTFYEAVNVNKGILKGRVLDLGCGIGIFTKLLSDVEGTKVVGLDISRESVLHARERCDNRCSFLAGSATELPFPDSSFDAVVALGDTISHIHNGYKEAISEVGRILKPGGHLLFDVDNKWNLGLLSEPHELKAALQTITEGHIREWSFLDAFGEQCSLHFKTFRPSEIKGLLNDAGLTVLDFQGLIILPNIIPQQFHYNHSLEKPMGRAVMALSKLDQLVHRLPLFRGLGIGALIVAIKR